MICTSYGTTDVAIPMQLELQGSRMEEILPHASVAKATEAFRSIWLGPLEEIC